MLWYGPSLYGDFRCIATACRHNCCVGWEIDIDEITAEAYRGITGDFGDRLSSSIVEENGISSFRLVEGDRCPFLNSQNLCDIHLELGEETLCQICRDHPRFRNYFSDHGEIGLGLSCEAAAELMINHEEPMTLVPLFEDDGEVITPTRWEEALLQTRKRLLAIAQDRTKAIYEREEMICDTVGAKLPTHSWAEWVDVFLALERMDPAWDKLLIACKEVKETPQPQNETPYEQFLVYLLFRHLADATHMEDLASRVAFCVLCNRLLRCIVDANLTEDVASCARLFSAEVEYSPDNTEELLTILDEAQLEGIL